MSTDLERLLAAAADDTDQPLHTDVDDILDRARRSVRKTRITALTTAALTTAAIIGGIAAWSTTRVESEGPAGTPTQTVTIDAETGKPIAPAPPVSPLSDSYILERCGVLDRMPTWDPQPWNKPGSLNSRWRVAVKTGVAKTFRAFLVSPDGRIGARCQFNDVGGSYGRIPITSPSRNGTVVSAGFADGLRVPADVTRILVDVPGEPQVRQARMGTDGFYTLGYTDRQSGVKPKVGPRLRGYAADGRKVMEYQFRFVVELPPIAQR